MTLTGKAVWDDDETHRRAQIWLCVNPAAIDRGGLDILPYVFAHEVICHAYQLAQGAPRQGEPGELCGLRRGLDGLRDGADCVRRPACGDCDIRALGAGR